MGPVMCPGCKIDKADCPEMDKTTGQVVWTL